MPGISVPRIAIPFKGKGGINYAAYWATLISATVETAAPTHVVLTFPSAAALVATDFTIAGFTIASGSWTGAVLTLVLSEAVLVFDGDMTITFVTTGETATVTNNVADDGNTITWYEPSLSTITKAGFNGNVISQVNDVLGSGVDLKQSTDNLKPFWSSQGLYFNLKYMTTDAMTLEQPVFAYIVLIKTGHRNYNEGIIDGIGAQSGFIMRYNFSNYYIAGAGANLSAPQAQNPLYDEVAILKVYFNGANSKFIIDDNAAITGNAGAGNMGGINIGRIGAVGAGTTQMMLKEVIVRGSNALETEITAGLKYKHKTSKTYRKILIIGDSISDWGSTYWVNNFDAGWNKTGTPMILNLSLSGMHVFDDFAPMVTLATTYDPEIIIVELGTNDVDDESWEATYVTALEQLITDHPTASIYCMDCLNETAMPYGTRVFKNAQIASAVAQVEGVTLWNTDGWIVPATDTVDGYHPNALGGAKIAAEILSRI